MVRKLLFHDLVISSDECCSLLDQDAGDDTPFPTPVTTAGNLNFSIRLNKNNNNNNNKLCLLIHKLLLHSSISYKAF